MGGGDGGGFVISTLPETVILRVAPEAIVLMDGTNVGGANLKEHVPPKPIQHHPYHTIMCWGHSRSTFQFRITVATEVPLPAGHSSGGGDEGGGSRSGVGGSGTDGPGHDAGRGAPPAKADGKDSPSAAGGAEGAEAGGGGAGGEQAAADYRDLGPVLQLRPAIDLRGAEFGDDRDEGGTGDLQPQLDLDRAVEFFRSVDGHAVGDIRHGRGQHRDFAGIGGEMGVEVADARRLDLAREPCAFEKADQVMRDRAIGLSGQRGGQPHRG